MKKTLAFLLCALFLLTSMPLALAQAQLADDQTFTFASANDLTTLDVSLMNDEMSGLVMYAVNDALIRHEDGKVVPGIAETYDVSDDGLTYTFHLRDAQWSDGVPVTAGDFVYSWMRTLDPATGSSQVENFNSIKGAIAYYSGESTDPATVGITAADDKTLVVTLEAADPFFIESMARGINFYPIRKDYVDKYGADYASSPDKFIGCGPFTLTEWVQTASLTMEKNPTYWDAANISLNKVVELIVGDANTASGMYDLGEVDALYSLNTAQTLTYPEYKSKESGTTLQFLSFMTEDGKVMANQNLRLALSWAINREAVVNAVSAPGTTVADRMVIPSQTLDGESIAATYPATDGIPAQGDVNKAKEYLNAALADLGLTSADQLPTIRYVAMESSTHKAMAEALQAQWQQNLGVKVDIDIRPVPQAIGALLSGDFDIFLVSTDAGVDPDTLLSNFVVDGSNNYSHWNNQDYTDLINAQAFETDYATRFTTLVKAEQMILDAAAVAPLWAPGGAYVAKDYVQGLSFGTWTGSIEFLHTTILAH
ncbi:MAG TPA: peptide ABC transporter substrate-binding protein [Candidatus Limiplasma sp.]|nr:peptide ABC transporter substrate-binding protein [Candidatus Limiplasma sp.]HPS82171.1 peptide ABC transporter substrate-binding protein [Candidatus Limiplasma sp.]